MHWGKRHAPARWFRRPSTDWRSRRRAPPRPVPQWDHACPQETARRAEAPPGPDTRPARLHAAAEDGHRAPRLRAGRRRRRRAGAVRLRRRTGRRGLRRPGRRPPRARLPRPRPDIVPRAAWIGDAARDQPPPRYDDQVVAVFIHHTDSPNGYDCADAPGILRALYEGRPRAATGTTSATTSSSTAAAPSTRAGRAAPTGPSPAPTPRASTTAPRASPPSAPSPRASRCPTRCCTRSPP